jgi:hypothetical protein
MKAQAWYPDFIIAIVAFSLALVFFFSLLPNLKAQMTDTLEDVYVDSVRIAGNLMAEGYPPEWTAADVVSIGIASGGRLDKRKVNELGLLSLTDYYRAKRSLGTRSDFLVYFHDQEGRMQRIGDFHMLGSPLASCTDDGASKRIAYYASAGSLLHAEMALLANRTKADVVKYDGPGLMMPDLGDYDAVLIENPNLSQAQTGLLEAYVGSGRAAFLSGIINQDSKEALSCNLSYSDALLNSTVIYEDTYLDLQQGQQLLLRNNTADCLMTRIAGSGNMTTIARWRHGPGTVLYLSSFEGLEVYVEEAMEQYIWNEVINATLNLTAIEEESLASVSRISLHSRKPTVMVVMAWR